MFMFNLEIITGKKNYFCSEVKLGRGSLLPEWTEQNTTAWNGYSFKHFVNPNLTQDSFVRLDLVLHLKHLNKLLQKCTNQTTLNFNNFKVFRVFSKEVLDMVDSKNENRDINYHYHFFFFFFFFHIAYLNFACDHWKHVDNVTQNHIHLFHN